MAIVTRTFTWRPDIPDFRDYTYTPSTSAQIQSMVDLRNQMSPVEDQGKVGSCTGCAVAGALEFLQRKATGTYTDISRLFLYYNGRAAIGTQSYDSGATLRDVVKSAAKLGACSESIWPYMIGKYTRVPTSAAYADAAKNKVTEYMRIETLDGVRQCLSEGFPVVFGFTAYSAFMSPAVTASGVLDMPGRLEKAIGGHAAVIVGYSDASKRVLVRNSWGPKWGDNGYFTMPYDYVSNRSLSDDFWTIRK